MKKEEKLYLKLIFQKNLPLDDDVNISKLAKEFDNVSGADIKDIIFMAAITALERDSEIVSMEDFKVSYKDIKNRYKEA